jgi:hypothetical protein
MLADPRMRRFIRDSLRLRLTLSRQPVLPFAGV